MSKHKQSRCSWVDAHNPLSITYHDAEWGVPVFDDKKLFEFIVLEGAQAGLSWQTILNRREGYRKTFKHFDPNKVARMNAKDVKTLLQNQHIIRNRLKITSAINNAKQFLIVQKEFGSFAKYIWGFVKGKPIQNKHKTAKTIPAVTPLAIQISKDLKKRGFAFVGPTIVYAHMQATGMVNDHTVDCFRYLEVKKEKF